MFYGLGEQASGHFLMVSGRNPIGAFVKPRPCKSARSTVPPHVPLTPFLLHKEEKENDQ